MKNVVVQQIVIFWLGSGGKFSLKFLSNSNPDRPKRAELFRLCAHNFYNRMGVFHWWRVRSSFLLVLLNPSVIDSVPSYLPSFGLSKLLFIHMLIFPQNGGISEDDTICIWREGVVEMIALMLPTFTAFHNFPMWFNINLIKATNRKWNTLYCQGHELKGSDLVSPVNVELSFKSRSLGPIAVSLYV